jgi:hypothetical protein
MNTNENKTKGRTHTLFLKKHEEVDEVKKVWIAVAKKHM